MFDFSKPFLKKSFLKKIDCCLNKLLNNIGSIHFCFKTIENGLLNSNIDFACFAFLAILLQNLMLPKIIFLKSNLIRKHKNKFF